MPLDRDVFSTPPLEYASAPFWSWNDRLQDGELIRQIREMKEKGWGGFFIHAREGLETPYLSREWMSRVRACVQEARDLKMHAWLYDEDKWPSGYAGGQVARLGKKYRAKYLTVRIDTSDLTAFDGLLDERGVQGLKRTDSEKSGEEVSPVFAEPVGHTVLSLPGDLELEPQEVASFTDEARKARLVFSASVVPLGDHRFNGSAYADLLSPEATDAFIVSTHEEYRKEVGPAFGYSVPGIFTDEPVFNVGFWTRAAYGSLPWTDDLPRVFREQNGYDLLDHLPELFFDLGEYRKVRVDFWSTATDLFVRSFTRRLFDWCERNNLQLTGHFLHEDNLLDQLRSIGAAMPHYEYMQRPGIDFLTRTVGYIGEGFDAPQLRYFGVLTAKQCTSVAHQLGKSRVLSELYGAAGQSCSFEDRRWIGDWHLIHGINAFCPHLSLYSMRGCRKRDYPPNLFYQQPWWKYTRSFEDYQTRLCYALTRGKRKTDVLLLHPMGSAWAAFRPEDHSKVLSIHDDLQRIGVWLLQEHYDFDYADEKILSKYGTILDRELRIGHQAYNLVVVPPSVTWFDSTVQFLKRFVDQGGRVLTVSPLPECVDGVADDEFQEWISALPGVPVHRGEFAQKLRELADPPLELTDENGNNIGSIWYHHRKTEKGEDILFLSNVSREKGFEATLKFPAVGKWEQWDALTGQTVPIEACLERKKSVIEISFEPTESFLLVRTDAVEAPSSVAGKSLSRKRKITRETPIDGNWTLKPEEPNAFLLDYCFYEFPDRPGNWSEPVPVFMAHQAYQKATVRDHYRIAYFVEILSAPAKNENFELAIELPEGSSLAVNGHPIAIPDKAPFWRDISWTRVRISGYLEKGMNEITLSGPWKDGVELENAYLLGNFGVFHEDRTRFWVDKEPHTASVSNLVDGGFPFFTGEMTLSQDINLPKPARGERVSLDMDGIGATLVLVRLNGKEAGTLFWRPFTLDVTDLVRSGKNRLEIRLVTSLFNLLGPHNHAGGDLHACGPESFRDIGSWVERYTLNPLGPIRPRFTSWK